MIDPEKGIFPDQVQNDHNHHIQEEVHRNLDILEFIRENHRLQNLSE